MAAYIALHNFIILLNVRVRSPKKRKTATERMSSKMISPHPFWIAESCYKNSASPYSVWHIKLHTRLKSSIECCA